MNTISESFDRAFRDKSVSNNQRAVNDSDSDSAKEQEKVIVEKRQKKRRRTTNRSKVAKLPFYFDQVSFLPCLSFFQVL